MDAAPGFLGRREYRSSYTGSRLGPAPAAIAAVATAALRGDHRMHVRCAHPTTRYLLPARILRPRDELGTSRGSGGARNGIRCRNSARRSSKADAMKRFDWRELT